MHHFLNDSLVPLDSLLLILDKRVFKGSFLLFVQLFLLKLTVSLFPPSLGDTAFDALLKQEGATLDNEHENSSDNRGNQAYSEDPSFTDAHIRLRHTLSVFGPTSGANARTTVVCIGIV